MYRDNGRWFDDESVINSSPTAMLGIAVFLSVVFAWAIIMNIKEGNYKDALQIFPIGVVMVGVPLWVYIAG